VNLRRAVTLKARQAEAAVRRIVRELPPEVSVTENLGNFDFFPSVCRRLQWPSVPMIKCLGHQGRRVCFYSDRICQFYASVCRLPLSGKGHAVRHLQRRLNVPRERTFAIFDDDNDLAMAAAVSQGFAVRTATRSVAAAVRANPHWKVARQRGVLPCLCAECGRGSKPLVYNINARKYICDCDCGGINPRFMSQCL
jgi:hypothetical protein